MRERIEKILQDEGISSSKFADEIGIQRSSISHILSGRNKPSLDVFQRILRKFPNINSEWLILGLGNMYKGISSLNESKTLFNNDEINSITEKSIEIVANKTSKEVTPIHKIEKQSVKTIVGSTTGDKTIEKIIVFYSDKSFESYTSFN